MVKIDLTKVNSGNAVALLRWMAKSVDEEIAKRDKRIEELEFKLSILFKDKGKTK